MRIVMFALTAVALTGCEVVAGSGDLASETREVSLFDSLRVASAVGATVDLSASDPGVELLCDDNLLQYIQVTSAGGTLTLEVDNGIIIDPVAECQALIAAPDLASIEVSGSGDVTTTGRANDLRDLELSGSGTLKIDDIDVSELVIDATGSGRMTLEGKVGLLDVFHSSSGHTDAEDLDADDVVVELTGSGDVDVTALQSADITVSGSGTVTVYGDPSDFTESVTGSGSIDVR